jgi:hypothetical protein
LRLVELAGLSGVNKQEKINIAVAIFLRQTDTPNKSYEYRNFDPMTWKFYLAWLELRQSPKFHLDLCPVSSRSDDPMSSSSEECDKKDGIVMKTEQEHALDRRDSRGIGWGRNETLKDHQATVKKEDREKKCKQRHDDVMGKMQRLVEVNEKKVTELQLSREMMAVRSALVEFTDDDDVRKNSEQSS